MPCTKRVTDYLTAQALYDWAGVAKIKLTILLWFLQRHVPIISNDGLQFGLPNTAKFTGTVPGS